MSKRRLGRTSFARCLRRPGWLLLAASGCTFEADLLSSRRVEVDIDAAAGSLLIPDSGIAPRPYYDAGSSYVDSATWNQEYDAQVGENSRYDGAIPLWPKCDNTGVMFDQAQTGDRCSFVGGCARPDGLPCTLDTAYCSLNSILLRSTVGKESCLPDDPGLGVCAQMTQDCCFWMGACGSLDPLDPTSAGRFCADDCEWVPRIANGQQMLGCPNGRGDQTWPPSIGGSCVGNFMCDSSGFSIGAMPTVPSFDQYGRIYFCQFDVMQVVAAGPVFPWN